MKNFLIEILLIFVPSKSIKTKWRRILRFVSLKGLRDLFTFKNREVRPNTVLLFESNHCHGEILPGFSKYFIDLGFNVDILANERIVKENPFCAFKENVNIFKYSTYFIPFLHKLSILKKYKYVIVMTSKNFTFEEQTVKLFHLEKIENLIIVEHNVDNIPEFKEEILINKNRLITLWEGEAGIPVVPSYIGNVRIKKEKNLKTNFIVVGGIQKYQKNYDLLIDAIKSLSKTTTQFKITIVGEGSLEDIDNDCQRFIDIKGRLSFKDMYKEMEQADFFLPLLDYDNINHRSYLTKNVTGSALLVFEFLKPCIIQRQFAEVYKFNDSNSIIYKHNQELLESMEKATMFSQEEYTCLINNLEQTKNDIEKMSKENLRKIID